MALRRRRRWIARLAGLVLAVLAFLRAPFSSPGNGTVPWWPPTDAPRASAATAQPTPFTPANRSLATSPVRFALSPYRYYPPADLSLQTLSLDNETLASLVEEKLTLLEGFGDRRAGRDVLFLLGAEHQAAGDFGRAADFYEAFVAHPDAEICDEGQGCEAAIVSLENAIAFRRALGDHEAAIVNADEFESRFSTRDPRAATRIALVAADLDANHRTVRLQRLRARRLPPAEAIQTEVRLGKALWSEERPAARRAFRRAERLWRRHGGPQMATSRGLSVTAWIAEIGRTREALAEARFIEANRRFHVASQSPPGYEGVPSERRVQRWVQAHLRPWMARRLRGIRSAERALDAVDELGLSHWTVPATSLRGRLYQDLADAIDGLQIPNAIVPDNSEEIGAVVQYREPIQRHLIVPAMRHFRSCMQLARETRAYGEHSDRCADGLARYEPRWRHPQELRPNRTR